MFDFSLINLFAVFFVAFSLSVLISHSLEWKLKSLSKKSKCLSKDLVKEYYSGKFNSFFYFLVAKKWIKLCERKGHHVYCHVKEELKDSSFSQPHWHMVFDEKESEIDNLEEEEKDYREILRIMFLCQKPLKLLKALNSCHDLDDAITLFYHISRPYFEENFEYGEMTRSMNHNMKSYLKLVKDKDSRNFPMEIKLNLIEMNK